MARSRFWNIIRRGESGPRCQTKEFDFKVFKTAKALAEKYNLKFNPADLVPTDDETIDNAFQAGKELLLETGVLNVDSGRVIAIEAEELCEAIERSPAEMVLGEGKDRVTLRNRKIEDPSPPTITGGIGCPISEDLRLKFYMAYAQEPVIDVVEHLPVSTFQGIPIKAGTP